MAGNFSLVSDVLAERARTRGDHPAVTMHSESLTFSELETESIRACHWLARHNVRRGDRLVIVAKSRPSLITLFFACARIGATFALLNTRLSAREVSDQLEDASPTLILADKDCLALVSDLHAPLIALDTAEQEITAETDAGFPVTANPHDALVMMFTSGTTGRAKGVVVTQSAWLAARADDDKIGDFFTWRDGESAIIVTPLFHIAGLGYAYIGLHHGETIHLAPDFVPSLIFKQIEETKATRTLLVPAMLAIFMQDPAFASADLSSLRQIGYGAAPMPLPLLTKGRAIFPDADFVQLYGMTETVGCGTYLPPDDHDHQERVTSAGKPYPSIQIEIRDAEGAECPPRTIGEVWMKSPTVMREYWGRKEETDEVLVDGWYATGDGGYLDEDGYLYLRDRIKDMIITGGENVYPSELEGAVAAIEGVREVAVFGTPHDVWGEAVSAAISLMPGAELDLETLKSHLEGKFAGFKIPRRLTVLEMLPRNPSGKILKRTLRDLYAADPSRFADDTHEST